MKVLIFREERPGVMAFVDSVTVADTSADPETAAWTTWQRTGQRGRGDYAVLRAGKRFSVVSRQQMVATAKGPM